MGQSCVPQISIYQYYFPDFALFTHHLYYYYLFKKLPHPSYWINLNIFLKRLSFYISLL